MFWVAQEDLLIMAASGYGMFVKIFLLLVWDAVTAEETLNVRGDNSQTQVRTQQPYHIRNA